MKLLSINVVMCTLLPCLMLENEKHLKMCIVYINTKQVISGLFSQNESLPVKLNFVAKVKCVCRFRVRKKLKKKKKSFFLVCNNARLLFVSLFAARMKCGCFVWTTF